MMSYEALEKLGRERLSTHFYMRDFLYSEISNFYGKPNIPNHPDRAIAVGKKLCQELLEPLKETFGHVSIRSSYRSLEVNQCGNENGRNCARNEKNFAGHIWDELDAKGHMGATACIFIPWFHDRFNAPGDWKMLAWWIHDHLPYSHIEFFPVYWAFNLSWHESPVRSIYSYITDERGYLTRPGMENHEGSHAAEYARLTEALSALRKP